MSLPRTRGAPQDPRPRSGPPRGRGRGLLARGLAGAWAIGLTVCAPLARDGAAGPPGGDRLPPVPPLAAEYRDGVGFKTPSENVACQFTPAGEAPDSVTPPLAEARLTCDRAAPAYLRFTMGARGPAERAESPPAQDCCHAESALAYGRSIRMGPFVCRSERTGLTCTRGDGAGFVVSRARAEVF